MYILYYLITNAMLQVIPAVNHYNLCPQLTLRSLSEVSHGSYHCYTANCEDQIYTGTDISIILKEIQKAQEVINKIKEMRDGMMGSALVSIMNEVKRESFNKRKKFPH